MGNAMNFTLKRLKDSKKNSKDMNEVFFYDPREEKVEINSMESAMVAFKNFHDAAITAAFSCDELVKGVNDGVRHMGRRSGT
jgi:hypothetical protein